MSEVEKAVRIFEQEGGSLKRVTQELGISFQRARKLLTAKGIIINETHEKILNLYSKGKTPKEIADELKLSINTIRSYLPPVRPLYKINQSTNALRIATWRKNKKNNGE